ncbi:molybdopterin cofactor-binding domain-containing protein [Paraburkholderia sp. SIMBA_049]
MRKMPFEDEGQHSVGPLLSRRSLLKSAGSAAFLLAFNMPVRAALAGGDVAAKQLANSFLSIGTDNLVTAIIAQTEGGQGNSTGIPQVIAAELGADWTLMRYRFTTERRPEYINPMLYEGLVLTAGSSSISGFYDTLRLAAATTREMLVSAAADHLKVSKSECTVSNSFVSHAASGRRMSFGQLAASAAKQAVPTKPALRSRADLSLIGQPLARLDVPTKCDGSARFGLDAEVPGMLYAAVRHGPAYGSTIASIDDSIAKAMPGVKLVMAIPQGVAVVADQYWQAVKALATVHETYAPHPNASASSATLDASLRKSLGQPGVSTPGSHGDVQAAMKGATTIIEGEFTLPILSHACMEPVSCTASVEGDKCEIWLSTKSPTIDSRFAAEPLGIDPMTVVVHNHFQGGDFGRRSGREHTIEAVLISKAAGRPVKVIWTRAEDLRVDQHRTAVIGRARMGLDAAGMPVAYEAKIASDGVWRSMFPWWYAKKKPLDLPLFTLVGSSYGIPNESGTYVLTPHPVRIGAFRGNNETHNGFLLETIIDEAAHASKSDPLKYRRKLLKHDPRSTAVIDRAAELAGWGNAVPGRYQGVAFYQSEFYRCRLAVIVEVSTSEKGIKVERIVGVCDSGLVINPLLAERCIEAGMVFGLSNTLYERITLSGGAPEQRNFNDYRVLRFDETPEIKVEVISVGEQPGSFGEIGVVPVGAALGNAIFAATGDRLRSQPFSAYGAKFA